MDSLACAGPPAAPRSGGPDLHLTGHEPRPQRDACRALVLPAGSAGDSIQDCNGRADRRGREVTDHTAARRRVYFLRVYPFREADDPAGSYSITLD